MGDGNIFGLWCHYIAQVILLAKFRLHDAMVNILYLSPSAAAVEGFDERSRIERGQLIGPRIFTVGEVIYGAGEPSLHQDIANQEEAYSALRRLKAEGGPASISYKNYNLPSRCVVPQRNNDHNLDLIVLVSVLLDRDS
jgi:hypothetical protein